MKPALPIICAALALCGCREETASLPGPVDLTAQAVGFYCQMDLLDHDGPKGQIHLSGMPAPIFFSQVRDAIAYLHMPEQSHAVLVTYVQDMAGAASWDEPSGWIDVTKAVYVIGSDRMGGMNAPEFVPFSDPGKAREFMTRHGGELRRYEDISTSEALAGEAPQAEDPAETIADRLKSLTGEKGSN